MVPQLAVLAVLAWSVAGAAEKPRIFLTESSATQLSGETNIDDKKGTLNFTGGTSKESIEVMKAFMKRCPGVVITANREKADFIVRFDRDEVSPITPFVKGNKVAVFNRDEDLIYSSSSRYSKGSVDGACSAILKHTK